jgi:hypothetical protein
MSEVDLRLSTGLEVGDLHVEKILAGLSPEALFHLFEMPHPFRKQ